MKKGRKMKKSLIAASILICMPVFAACPIDGDTAACSVAGAMNFPSSGIDRGFNTNVGQPKSGTSLIPEASKPTRLPEYVSIPSRVTPSAEKNYTNDNPLRDFRQTQGNYSYNSSCQFGVCGQTGAPQLFQQRGE